MADVMRMRAQKRKKSAMHRAFEIWRQTRFSVYSLYQYRSTISDSCCSACQAIHEVVAAVDRSGTRTPAAQVRQPLN